MSIKNIIVNQLTYFLTKRFTIVSLFVQNFKIRGGYLNFEQI